MLRVVCNSAVGANTARAAIGKARTAAGTNDIMKNIFRILPRYGFNQLVAVAVKLREISFGKTGIQLGAYFFLRFAHVRRKLCNVTQTQDLDCVNQSMQFPLCTVGNPKDRYPVKATARKGDSKHEEQRGDWQPGRLRGTEDDKGNSQNHKDGPRQCERKMNVQ